MSSIDRLAAQDAARTYVQNTDVARSGAQHTAKATQQKQHHQALTKVDSVTLSDSARSLASARDAVTNAPDIRDQKVADIKQQVSSGTYNVPSRVLARRMLDAAGNQT